MYILLIYEVGDDLGALLVPEEGVAAVVGDEGLEVQDEGVEGAVEWVLSADVPGLELGDNVKSREQCWDGDLQCLASQHFMGHRSGGVDGGAESSDVSVASPGKMLARWAEPNEEEERRRRLEKGKVWSGQVLKE